MQVTPTEREFRPWMQGREFHLVVDRIEYKDLIDECCSVERYGFDTETDGLHPTEARTCGICLSPDPKRGYYAPIRHRKGKNLDLDVALEGLQRLADSDALNDMYNAQFDMQMSVNDGIHFHFKKIRDAQISWWLIDSSRKLRGGLKAISKQHFGYDMLELWELFFNKKPNKKQFMPTVHLLDPTQVTVYGSSDAMVTTELQRSLERDRWWKMQEKIFYIEMAMIECLREMERHPIQLDLEYIDHWNKRISNDMAECEHKIYKLAGQPFNIQANAALAKLLYNQLGLPCTKVTGKNNEPSVDDEALAAIRTMHPIVPIIQEYKTLHKLHSTYLLPFTTGHDENGMTRIGFFHPATETGRIQGRKGRGFAVDGKLEMSITTAPKNKKELPNIYDPRQVVVARPGWLLASIDYANEEMRIAANMSGEENWIEALLNGENMHRKMAALIFGVPMDQVTPEQYAAAKAANFKYLYGGGSPKEEIYRMYYAAVPTLKSWQDAQKSKMNGYGYVQSAWGRVRRAEDLVKSQEWGRQMLAERIAVNSPVQSSGGDVLRLAVIGVLLRKLRHEHPELKEFVFVRLLVHDEICYEIATDETLKGSKAWEMGWTFDKILYMICEVMEGIGLSGWPVPLLVDGHVSRTWSSTGARKFDLDRVNKKVVWIEVKQEAKAADPQVFSFSFAEVNDEKVGVLSIPSRNQIMIARAKALIRSAYSPERGHKLQLLFEDSESKITLPQRYNLDVINEAVAPAKKES